MPALPADIFAAKRAARIITREDSAVLADYPGARDNQANPSPGFFDDAADASAALVLEAALIGVFRRRFSVEVVDLLTFDGAPPTFHLTDAEQQVDSDCLVTRYEIDLEQGLTRLELLG